MCTNFRSWSSRKYLCSQRQEHSCCLNANLDTPEPDHRLFRGTPSKQWSYPLEISIYLGCISFLSMNWAERISAPHWTRQCSFPWWLFQCYLCSSWLWWTSMWSMRSRQLPWKRTREKNSLRSFMYCEAILSRFALLHQSQCHLKSPSLHG